MRIRAPRRVNTKNDPTQANDRLTMLASGAVAMEPPSDMPMAQKKVWYRVMDSRAPELFCPADYDLLIQYCSVTTELADLQRGVDKVGITKASDRLVRLRDAASRRSLTISTRLKLAPNGRLSHEGQGMFKRSTVQDKKARRAAAVLRDDPDDLLARPIIQ